MWTSTLRSTTGKGSSWTPSNSSAVGLTRRSSTRGRTVTPASRSATPSPPSTCRSWKCTERTSLRESPNGVTRRWPRERGRCSAALAPSGTSWRSADWLPLGRRVSDRRSERLAALIESLSAAHLDGLLVTSLPNIRYLTGFSGTSALLFVTAREAHLVTDFRYQTQVKSEVGDLARVTV